jgi:hypothetical protein
MRAGIAGNVYLDEANVGGLLTEALTADVEAVLANQTGGVLADAAVMNPSCQLGVLDLGCFPGVPLFQFHSSMPFYPPLPRLSPLSSRLRLWVVQAYQWREPLP